MHLGGWTLSDEDGHTYTFHHVRLDGRCTVRDHTGVSRDSRTDVNQDRRNYVWNNDQDTATLCNDRGRFVDDESWGYHDGDRDGGHPGGDRHGGGDRHVGGARH